MVDNNKGVTLVEMIISVSVAAIIVAGIGSFIVFCVKSYEKSNNTVKIEVEAQTVVNTLSNYIMEATEYESTYEDGDMIIYTGKIYIVYDGASNLYLYEDGEDITSNREGHLASQNITVLEIDNTNIEENNSVNIYIEVSRAGVTKTMSTTVYIRNEIRG